MANLPILFSAPMIRAILREIEAPGTGKTQTRRVLPVIKGLTIGALHDEGLREPGALQAARHQVQEPRIKSGDRLYVREEIRFCSQMDQTKPSKLSRHEPRMYTADGYLIEPACMMLEPGKRRPPMFMPRWASRITLHVTGVRVERLNDITEDDAKAEGADLARDDGRLDPTYRLAFANLWMSLHGPEAWDANPWVAVYEFRPVLGNIDRVGPR